MDGTTQPEQNEATREEARVTKYDYVSGARRIITRFDQCVQPVVFNELSSLPEDLYASVAALHWCCGSTSQSICELAKIRQIWDMQILLRVVVNATAKFCYLLCMDELKRVERITDYVELATKGDCASMEQPLNALFKIGVYGTGERLSFATREFKEKNAILKTQEGESDSVKTARQNLDYWNMTRVLTNEFWYWKEMGPKFDFEYAAANKMVHLNYTGCGEVMRRIYGLQKGTYNIDDDDATISQMLFTLCALYKARCESAFAVAGIDPGPIRGILVRTDPFVKYSDEMCEKASKKVMGI